jgi:uncharacterized protein (TIGR02688 family)
MTDAGTLDRKVAEVFAGKVVRKDLVRRVKVGANVPAYVLEYLLGKYCATDDPVALEGGLRLVNLILAENFVHPDESVKAQSQVREKGRHSLIDKVKVRYLAEDDKYWAELVHFGHRYVHVPEKYVREYDRLLVGGIWAQVQIQHLFDEEARGSHRSPFWIEQLQPIQIATFDFADYCAGRRQLATDEWMDLLLRSMGLEPEHFDRRRKLLLLVRLVPLCEPNYNLLELGPRGTGKSYSFQELSPYVILLTGPTTVANLFYNLATNRIGLVGLWDAVAFDEVADLQKMPRDVITTLKTYCESGTFARGKEALSGHASIALFGNTNQPVEVMVRSSHLFMPLPEVIREDMVRIPANPDAQSGGIRTPRPAESGRPVRKFPDSRSGESGQGSERSDAAPGADGTGVTPGDQAPIWVTSWARARSLRMDSPRSSRRYAPCTKRSSTASATVGSGSRACQRSTGSWLATRVERRPQRSSRRSNRSRASVGVRAARPQSSMTKRSMRASLARSLGREPSARARARSLTSWEAR